MYCSEESDDGEERSDSVVDVYRKKYRLIMERCHLIQQENERLVDRYLHVKAILKRSRRERKFLMDRLDQHGDNWRDLPLTLRLEDNSEYSAKPKSGGKTKGCGGEGGKRRGGGGPTNSSGGSGRHKKKPSQTEPPISQALKPPLTPAVAGGGGGSQAAGVTTPRRPPNAYLQYCREQRSAALQEMLSLDIGQAEPSKVDVTKHLAYKWSLLNQEDKKVYYERYRQSREQYKAELELYTSEQQQQHTGTPAHLTASTH